MVGLVETLRPRLTRMRGDRSDSGLPPPRSAIQSQTKTPNRPATTPKRTTTDTAPIMAESTSRQAPFVSTAYVQTENSFVYGNDECETPARMGPVGHRGRVAQSRRPTRLQESRTVPQTGQSRMSSTAEASENERLSPSGHHPS